MNTSIGVCTLCNLNDLEDDFHFVLICPFYETLRKQLIPRYYAQRPSMYKFECMYNRIQFQNSFKIHFKHTKTLAKINRSEHQICLEKMKKKMSQNQWSAVVGGVLYKYSAECAMKPKRFASVTKGLLCL